MNNILLTFLAYIIDKVFGEFNFIKHPVIYIGNIISHFERYFYKDSITRGLFLLVTTLSITTLVSIFINYITSFSIVLNSIVASMFIAHNMLYNSVKDILTSSNKQETIAMLVSRDTSKLSDSDVYKAGIETYSENLSDGVIAPLFYLLIFGLVGIIFYKTVNTLDSMVGYRTAKYENYGKASAILDDILNYIPSRITAILIMIIAKEKNIFAFYKDGAKHDSPNAGHPITAMALCLEIKLGGDTSYFGKIKHKPYFGIGRKKILASDLVDALSVKTKIDFFILVSLALFYMIIISL
jgi:adenosylcobinamide-phosphate synthase